MGVPQIKWRGGGAVDGAFLRHRPKILRPVVRRTKGRANSANQVKTIFAVHGESFGGDGIFEQPDQCAKAPNASSRGNLPDRAESICTGKAAVRTIIAATDLSARSDRALERAVQLAEQHGARLHVLHFVDEDLPQTIQEQLDTSARGQIDSLLGKLARPKPAELSAEVVRGAIDRDLPAIAEGVKADLLVLGIHRNESGRRPLAGTTIEKIVRQSHCPVLVVSALVKSAYRKVMIGVDFSVYSRIAVRAARSAAPDAEYFAVHAFQVPFEGFLPGKTTRDTVQHDHEREFSQMIEEEMSAFIYAGDGDIAVSAPIQKIVRQGDARSVLRSVARRLEPDLLVLGTHGRVGVARAFVGSVAEDFLSLPPCDVLVVKAW